MTPEHQSPSPEGKSRQAPNRGATQWKSEMEATGGREGAGWGAHNGIRVLNFFFLVFFY